MSTTTQRLAHDVATLTQRIADNEALWGPGCRPELRKRLRQAEADLARINAEQAHRQAMQAANNLTVKVIRLSDAGKAHASDDYGLPWCGTLPAGEHDGRWVTTTDGGAFMRRPDACGRCVTGIKAWGRND